MDSLSVEYQKLHGTYDRNLAIIGMYKLGVPQAEIARQFTARGHKMSRQQVGQIIKREVTKSK